VRRKKEQPRLSAKLLTSTILKEFGSAGCSKTLRYKAPETPRSESYSPVRPNDEG
jgi:hypothetical protein